MAVAIDTLAYARRLREAGFSEQQAEGQAEALAAAMTDTLATKQDLSEFAARQDVRLAQIDARFAQVDARFDRLEKHFDTRIDELERRFVLRLEELEKRTELRLSETIAHLERRMTMRLGGMMVAGIGVVSVISRLA